VALAKGALLKLQLLEQQVLLGAVGANSELMLFAGDMARKLQVRWGGEVQGRAG